MTKSGLISECSCAYEDSSTGSLSFSWYKSRHKRLVLQCLSISNKATAGTVCICDDVPGCTFSHSTSNSSYSLWPWKKTLFVQLFCFYHSDALFGQRPRTLLCRFALIAENSNRSCFLTAMFVPVLLCQFESSSSSKKSIIIIIIM